MENLQMTNSNNPNGILINVSDETKANLAIVKLKKDAAGGNHTTTAIIRDYIHAGLKKDLRK